MKDIAASVLWQKISVGVCDAKREHTRGESVCCMCDVYMSDTVYQQTFTHFFEIRSRKKFIVNKYPFVSFLESTEFNKN